MGKNFSFLLNLLWKKDKELFFDYSFRAIVNMLKTISSVLLIGVLVDSLERNRVQTALLGAVILCLGAFLLEAVTILLARRIEERAGEFRLTIRTMLADSLCRVGYDVFESQGFREKYRFAERCLELGSIESVLQAMVNAAGGLLSFAALFTVMSQITWWLLLVMLASVVIQVSCRVWQMRKNFETLQAQENVEYKMLYSRDRLTWKSFAKEVRLFRMMDYVASQANRFIDELSRLQKEHASKVFRALSLSSFVNGIQSFAVYGYILYGSFTGRFSLAEFSVLTASVLSVAAEAAAFAECLVSVKESGQYMKNYVDILNAAPGEGENPALAPVPGEIREISFDRVTFCYEGREEPALRDISLTLTAGKKYGIVGPNGSGKTTFTNLLMGLYRPTAGAVRLDGTDISAFSGEEYLRLFSAVFQDFHVYAYTVQDNLFLGEKVDKERAERVMESLGFHPRNGELDSFLQTYITSEYGENGTEFSGGEGQKIAIARALLQDAPVCIFDEPSASLSPKSEAELYGVIRDQLGHQTVILVSHRLASCILCDEILVFDKGVVVEQGSHRELMGKKGLYYNMFTLQRDLYVEE